jgi:GT2 family glycosyltransferase
MKNDSTIAVSVIIPTYNRYPLVIDTVKSLFPQLSGNDELIVVDQSDNDISEKIRKELSVIGNIVYKHVVKPSLPNARNIGIAEAKKDIVIFFDDDIIPSQQLIHAHRIGFSLAENIGCVTGKIFEEGKIAINSTNVGAGVTWYGKAYRNFNSLKKTSVAAPIGANMSFSRKALCATGSFDCDYSGNATLEETDYGYRLRKKGFTILYNPDALLTHLVANSGGCRENVSETREYHNIKNTTRFFLKNMKRAFFPTFCIYSLILGIKRLHQKTGIIKAFLISLSAISNGVKSYYKDPAL